MGVRLRQVSLYFEKVITVSKIKDDESQNVKFIQVSYCLDVAKCCDTYSGYKLAFKYSNISLPKLMIISDEPLLSSNLH